MSLSKLRTRLCGIVYAVAAAGLVAGCSGSGDTTANSTSGAGNSAPPITGVATPSSVSVVTATNTN